MTVRDSLAEDDEQHDEPVDPRLDDPGWTVAERNGER